MNQLTQHGSHARSGVGSLLFVAIALTALAVQAQSAQDSSQPAQKSGKEENAGKQEKPRPGAKEEQYENTPPKRRTPIRVGDEDTEQGPAGESQDSLATGLGSEAEHTTNLAARDLYRSLARAYDTVTLTAGPQFNAEPIATYVGSHPQFKGDLEVRELNEKSEFKKAHSFGSRNIAGVNPFEMMAIRKVDEFLKRPTSEPRMETLQEAERALEAVIRFHESALKRRVRDGEEWNAVGKQLRKKLEDVRLDEVRTVVDSKDWVAASVLAMKLSQIYESQKDVQDKLAAALLTVAQQPFENQDYPEVRKRLRVLDLLSPNNSAVEAIRDKLRKKAAELKEEALRLEKDGKTGDAIEKIRVARTVDPQLAGLTDLARQLEKASPLTLLVGVADLPENLSPALAYTDSEKQAVEMLFEGLIHLTPIFDPDTSQSGERITLGLAEEMPRQIPLGRLFQMARDAHWSNGNLVTGIDVRQTVQLLCDSKGCDREWAARMRQGDGARIENDALHVSLSLDQGFLDPLSLMTFKILPESLKSATDSDFAKKPIGSGPYMFQNRDDRNCTFIANPYYEGRPGKEGLPRIRDVQFRKVAWGEDPGADLSQFQVLLDIPSGRYPDVRSLRDFRLETLRNQRIYFLALNHRKPDLKNESLRRAIAFAIDRAAILKDSFNGEPATAHRSLNGPFPPESWAWNPSVPQELYDADRARALSQAAKTAGFPKTKLSLRYPSGDPAVKKACEQIQHQVEELTGVRFDLRERTSRELRHDVEDLQDYDLAYYHYDYPTPAYWLWPLFDPQATDKGGRNYLGYQNEKLESHFRKVMVHRDLSRVRSEMHQIHQLVFEQMPIIPLWQLDTHIAIHESVKHPDIARLADPLLIFRDLDKWSIERR
jgi:peptide/nickel transport system substrate-binding protein